MPLNRSLVGREYPASEAYEVSREKIREFADAIGDDNPLYRSAESAREAGHPDVIAPPTFLTVLGMRFAGSGPVRDPDLGLDYSRVVHGEQAFVHHRPVRAGDVLRAVSVISDIREAGRNELMTIRMEVSTSGGERVADAINTVVSRGTAAGGAT